METHVSATAQEETPHRAQSLIDNNSIEALAEIICGAGNQSAAALFVLMGMMQNSDEPDVLAHTVKHFAFTRCGELNVFGMVDSQIELVKRELLATSAVS
jgi:hypothetical protein